MNLIERLKDLVGNGISKEDYAEIIKNQEDAKAYNDLMKANAQVVKDNINITREHQIVEQVKKRIKGCECHCHKIMDTVIACADCDCIELQKVMDVWTDKHTKIAKESDEKFKTHTKDQEVDI